MLVVSTELRPSPIHGIGVFLLEPVKKGALIWRFDSRIDRVYTKDEVSSLPELTRNHINTYGFWHEASGLWILCGDHAKHFNHADNPSAQFLGAGFADDIAAYDLKIGDELTDNYHAICDRIRMTGKF